MIQSPATVGIALDSFERAALYFDHLFPVYCYWNPEKPGKIIDESRWGFPFPLRYLPSGFSWEDEVARCQQLGLTHRVFGGARDGMEYYPEFSPFILSRLPRAVVAPATSGVKSSKGADRSHPLARSKNTTKRQLALVSAVDRLVLDCERKKSRSVPVLDSDWIGLGSQKGFEVISVVSSSLLEIDTKRLTWDRVAAIREDKAAIQALRRYRQFWLDNFDQKPLSFIEDRMATKYQDFLAVCKKHDLDVIDTATNAVIDSKSLLAAGAVAITAAVSGQAPTPEVLQLLAAGLSLEIGKISMSIRRTTRDHPTKLRTNELIYLRDLSRLG